MQHTHNAAPILIQKNLFRTKTLNMNILLHDEYF